MDEAVADINLTAAEEKRWRILKKSHNCEQFKLWSWVLVPCCRPRSLRSIYLWNCLIKSTPQKMMLCD